VVRGVSGRRRLTGVNTAGEVPPASRFLTGPAPFDYRLKEFDVKVK
jgi:hypothetical protein